MARIRFGRRAAQRAQDDTGRPSGEAAVLPFCLETVREVSALEPAARACTDGELRGRTGAYRARLEGGEAAASLTAGTRCSRPHSTTSSQRTATRPWTSRWSMAPGTCPG